MTRALLAFALLLGLATGVRAEAVITAPGATGCKSGTQLFKIFYQEADLEPYLASGQCVRIAGWHYTLDGAKGRYGAVSAILTGPEPDGPRQPWFTLNKWLW